MIKERTIIAFYSTVTCQRQPALGCVYKLVEINGKPKIKLSQDVEKVTMPGKKLAFRLYSNDGHALIDLLTKPEEEPPFKGRRVRITAVPWTTGRSIYRSEPTPGKLPRRVAARVKTEKKTPLCVW